MGGEKFNLTYPLKEKMQEDMITSLKFESEHISDLTILCNKLQTELDRCSANSRYQRNLIAEKCRSIEAKDKDIILLEAKLADKDRKLREAERNLKMHSLDNVNTNKEKIVLEKLIKTANARVEELEKEIIAEKDKSINLENVVDDLKSKISRSISIIKDLVKQK